MGGDAGGRFVLETLFRKRFYLVHLAFTALLAVMLARVTTAIAARVLVEKLTTAAGQGPAKAPPPRAPTGPARDFTGLANANIFEGRREIVIDEPTAPAAANAGSGDVGDWRNAPRSALRLRLVGTMAFSEPTLSLCSIVEEGGSAKGADLYSINACENVDVSALSPEDQKLVGKAAPCNKIAEQAIVKRIEPEVVYIWNVADGRIEYLALNEPPAATAAPRVAAKSDVLEKPDDGGADGIVKTGDNQFGVPRSTVDNALNNLSELATQARVVPAFEGGKPVGFKLFSIKPGSLYSKIGLQNGDVINRINGYEMSSPEKGLEVYQKLKDSSNITVDIKRRGKAMTLDYTIQ
jgi:general secretion pathway protein C